MVEVTEKTWPALEGPTRWLALVSCAMGILAVTLFPVRAGLVDGFREGHWPRGAFEALWSRTEYVTAGDIFFNVLLFMPLGFFALPAERSLRRGGRFYALLVGVGLSASIELVQAAVPGRWPSLLDILANGLGAWLGALVLAWWTTRAPAPRSDIEL